MWFIYDFSAGIIAVLEWSTNSVNKEVVLYQSPDMFSGALGNLKRLLSYVMWLIVVSWCGKSRCTRFNDNEINKTTFHIRTVQLHDLDSI